MGGVQVVGGWRGRVKGKVGVEEGLGRGWGGVGGRFRRGKQGDKQLHLPSPILLVLLLVPREARVPYAPKLSFFVVRNVPL